LRDAGTHHLPTPAGVWAFRWTANLFVEPVALMHLRIGSSRIAVGLQTLTPFREFASLVASRAPAAMIGAWLEAKGSTLWKLIEFSTGSAVEVLNFEPFPSEKSKQGCRVGFEISQPNGLNRTRGLAYLPDKATFLALYKPPPGFVKPPEPKNKPIFDLDPCSIRVMATLGRTLLAKKELCDLAPGETVLLDRRPDSDPHEVELSVGLQATPFGYGRIDDRKIELTRLVQRNGDPKMLQSESPEPDANVLNDKLDQMQVELRFEIGRWRTSFSELRQMVPGSIIELDQSADAESVTVWVDRQRVATGRVVVVADQLGVQILGRTAH